MEKFYSVKEAARLIGVSTNTLYSYLESGKVKSQRIGGGRFRIPASELEPYIDKEKSTSTSRPTPKFSLFQIVFFLAVAFSAGGGVYLLAYTHPEVLGISKTSPTPVAIIVETKSPSPSATPTELPEPTASASAQTYKFALYNGTDVVGATASTEAKVRAIEPKSQVTVRAVAAKTDYDQSLLIDILGNRAESVSLSQELGIPLASLPDGEKRPENADFLIIVGKLR